MLISEMFISGMLIRRLLISGMFMVNGMLMVNAKFMVLTTVSGIFISTVLLLCNMGVNFLDLGPTPHIQRKLLFIPDFATAIFSLCFIVIKQGFSLPYLSSGRQVTYHNSIALAKICLAPVDEEMSSAALATRVVNGKGDYLACSKLSILRTLESTACRS